MKRLNVVAMASALFNVVLTGRLLPGGDRASAVRGLAKLLKLQEAQAQRLLSGRVTRLKKALSRDRAKSLMHALERLGVENRLQPVASEPVAVPGDASKVLAPVEGEGLAIVLPSMCCPKCGHQQPESKVCRQCGVVIDKVSGLARRGLGQTQGKEHGGFPFHVLNRVLQLVFLLSLGATVWGYYHKDQLPSADFYGPALFADPVQTKTSARPFTTKVNGIVYHIEPVADYELHGMVVSYHDSDAFIDVYHHKDWKDFINVRDLCVIWGGNVSSEVYREMEFKNTTWTCWAYWYDRSVTQRFTMEELSNNHLLADNPRVQEAIMQAEPGDHVVFKGMLARYSHSDGKFKRGTSTTRKDTGNGACETVFVKDFSVVEKANTGVRVFYALSGVVAVLAFLGLLLLLFIAPVRRS